MAIEKAFFRQVMGSFATGVTVVTTKSQGILGGITVNSFCSASLNPPLVLICIGKNSSVLPLLRESNIFAVNMLSDQQEEYSRDFATNSEERSKNFCNAAYHTAVTGAPVLDDVLAFVDTRIVAEYPGGDHIIFLGQVEAMGIAGKINYVTAEGQELPTVDKHATEETAQTIVDGKPLLYFAGQYRNLVTQYREPSIVGAHPENREEQVNGR
jgi:Conserved protein/domain typically associated with flavoprotein oxygenases, DIM6/NTAB family